jgi:alanyl-tRNA synthetase
VFLQYDKQADGRYLPLPRSNVDLGMGLERLLPIVQGVPSIYETDLLMPIVDTIRALATQPEPFAIRVIADHIRAAIFILAEGVRPGNTDQPYIVRRLIRRAVRYSRELGIGENFLARLAEVAIGTLADTYPELEQQRAQICAALDDEEGRFQRTLARGEIEFDKVIGAALASGKDTLSGPAAFRLYETYGFPLELTQELAGRRGVTVDEGGFQLAFAEHQAQSRQGSAARFRGGLAERLPETTRLHTATHLLHAALRQVLGPYVAQRGSNITVERLRFDFSHAEKLSSAQLAEVEALVNTQIGRDLPVTWAEMSVAEARDAGAIGLFGERYGEQVKVYTIGDWSKEICGGPHVERTGALGHFRIVKEEAVGAGARRVRAVLE